eukprot:jgi/Astpho2/6268/Aster-x0276
MPPQRSQWLQKKQRGMQVVPAFVHGTLILLFGAVWGWHLTPKANEQKVAQQFPWFFAYLTFWGFTLQLLQMVVAFLADLQPKDMLRDLADILSCSTVGVAAFVTACYYILVPKWVSPVLHTGNFIGMLADYAVSRRQRTFSHAGAALQAAWMALYLALCLAIKHVNGKYPYDFMNELPEPQGMLLATVVLTGAVTITYYAARYGLATRFAEQHTQTLKHQ